MEKNIFVICTKCQDTMEEQDAIITITDDVLCSACDSKRLMEENN